MRFEQIALIVGPLALGISSFLAVAERDSRGTYKTFVVAASIIVGAGTNPQLLLDSH